MKRFFFQTIFILISSLVVAQEIPTDPKVKVGKLSNGLTYIIRHNEKPARQADFYIAQKVGSILEEDNQRGLAHFLEHMCFNGTKHFPGKSMINYLESIGVKFGANLNAYTSVDETVYNISNAPVTRETVIDSCLLILADWSCGLTLDPKEIDAERGVIHEEWRTRDNAQMRMMNQLLPKVYQNSKYAYRMPIGTMEVVDNFKPQALRAYYEKWYRPDQQAVIVVGDTAALDLRDSSPLIGVTATDSFYRRLADAMGEQACLLRQEMRIRLRLLAEGEKDVLDCLGRLQDFDLIAFTSANAVRIVQDIAKKEGIDLRHLPAARFAAIGPGTQAAIRDAFGGGGQAAVQVLVPDCYDSRDLARKIVQDISGRRVWMIRSAVGDPEMNAILDRGGISYHLTRLYRTEGELLADAQQLKRTGIHVFASASGVSCMFSAAEKEELDLHGTACACIGEATAARLRAWGLEPLFTASPHTAQELARWLKEYIKKGRS